MATRSLFWEQLSKEDHETLDRHGFDAIKRRQALHYFTWHWTVPRRGRVETSQSDQLAFLLRHARPGDWWAAWMQRVQMDDETWEPLHHHRHIHRRLDAAMTRLLWRYASRRGRPEVLELGEPALGQPLPIDLDGQR